MGRVGKVYGEAGEAGLLQLHPAKPLHGAASRSRFPSETVLGHRLAQLPTKQLLKLWDVGL
jgi:hypothetical protein